MTDRARIVLQDCRDALRELTDGVEGPQWRRRWVTTLVLLRTVAYVLNDVDGERDAASRRAVDDWWAGLKSGEKRNPPEPMIFWAFIDRERHYVVHQYNLVRAGHSVDKWLIEGSTRTEHEYWVNSGPYAGQRQADVVGEAIRWWEQQLDAIDAAC